MLTIGFPCREYTTFERIIRISLTFNYISYAKFKPPSQNILPEKYVIPFEQVYDMPIMIKYCDIFETTMNKKLFVLEDWSRLNIYITYSNHVSFISFL